MTAVARPSGAPRSPRRWGRTTALLVPIQLVLRLGEAIFPLLLAAWFGSSAETDVYFFASAVFTLAGAVVFSAFRDSAMIPILTEVRLRAPRTMPRVLGSYVTTTALAATACAISTGVVAGLWFWARYPGAERALALRMIPFFSGHLVVVALVFLFIAILQAFHRFVAGPVAIAIGMGAAIGVLARLRGPLGPVGIPVAQLVGEAVTLAVLVLWTLTGAGLRIAPTLSLPPPVRRFARLMLSHVSGQMLARLNPIVDQLVAGVLVSAGGVTLLKLTTDVGQAPIMLLAGTLLPVLLVHLSEEFAHARVSNFVAGTRRALVSVSIVLGVATLAFVLLRRPLLAFLYQRGAMTVEAIAVMEPVLVCQAVGLVPTGLVLVLIRAHVAAGNTRILAPWAAVAALVNLLLDVLLARPFGLPGIALATSAVQTVMAVAFFFRLRSHLAATRLVPPEDMVFSSATIRPSPPSPPRTFAGPPAG